MVQLISEKFQAALKYILEKEGRGAQTRLATQQDIDRGYLNAIVKGRVAGSDAVRAKIADHFEMTFEDMLSLGRKILEGKTDEILVDQDAGYPSDSDVKAEGKVGCHVPRRSGDDIAAAILKALEVLQAGTIHGDTLIGSIDVFHEAVNANMLNQALRDQMIAIDSRVARIEGVLADKKNVPRNLRKAFRFSMVGK